MTGPDVGTMTLDELSNSDGHIVCGAGTPGSVVAGRRTMPGSLDLPEAAWSLLVGVRPRSRGRASLRSASSDDAPAIGTGCLSDLKGLSRSAAGLETARGIGDSRALCHVTRRDITAGPLSGEALEHCFRDGPVTFRHPWGTAAMGQDDGAVVVGEQAAAFVPKAAGGAHPG